LGHKNSFVLYQLPLREVSCHHRQKLRSSPRAGILALFIDLPTQLRLNSRPLSLSKRPLSLSKRPLSLSKRPAFD
jgi:hypothetical protein